MPDHRRVVDSTGALALKEVPKRLLILGGDIICLEMGTVYSTLGARLNVIEMMDGPMQGADRELFKNWQKVCPWSLVRPLLSIGFCASFEDHV